MRTDDGMAERFGRFCSVEGLAVPFLPIRTASETHCSTTLCTFHQGRFLSFFFFFFLFHGQLWPSRVTWDVR